MNKNFTLLKNQIVKSKNRPKSETYLEHILVDNFKAFGKPTRVKLSPKINLIFGKNSTGKSSIIQALRLFRQSFGKDNLTPINLKSPDKFKNLGGLDFDIGYKGLIFGRKQKRLLSLGIGVDDVEYKTKNIDSLIIKCPNCNKNFKIKSELIPVTGRTLQCGSCNHIWSYKNTSNKRSVYNLISYSFKNIENFYRGEKVKKDNVILNGMSIAYSNKKHKDNLLAQIDFPKYVFFDQKGKTSKLIDQQDYSGDIKSGGVNAYYESIHKPYYYKVKLKPENLHSNFFDKLWDNFSSNEKTFVEYLNGFRDYVKEEFASIKKINSKKNNSIKGLIEGVGGLKEMINVMSQEDEFRRKISKIWDNDKFTNDQRKEELSKYKKELFNSITYLLFRRKSNQSEKFKFILAEIKNLISLFNSKKK